MGAKLAGSTRKAGTMRRVMRASRLPSSLHWTTMVIKGPANGKYPSYPVASSRRAGRKPVPQTTVEDRPVVVRSQRVFGQALNTCGPIAA